MTETQLPKDQALREGTALHEVAKQLTVKAGSEHEPTRHTYERAFNGFSALQRLDEKSAENLIETMNLWKEIRVAIGEKDAQAFADGAEIFMNENIVEFIRTTVNSQDDDGLKTFMNILTASPIWITTIERHPDIADKLTTYITGGFTCIHSVAEVMRENT